MFDKTWIEAQLQHEYQNKLKVEGKITLLEGMLKLQESGSGGSNPDQQAPAVEVAADGAPAATEQDADCAGEPLAPEPDDLTTYP